MKWLDAHDKTKTCGITTTLLLASNEGRRWVVLVNQGAFDAWVMLGGPAVADKGIYLKGGGGSLGIDMLTSPWYGAINGIAVGGASIITVLEVEART